MIERYTIHAPAAMLREKLAVDVTDAYQPSYNAGPIQLLPVITSEQPRGLSFFYWGLMARWSNNRSISEKSINLPIESAFGRAGFRRQVTTNRCVVPLSGFYVWKKVGKKQAVPYYLQSAQHPLMGMAGIWEEFEDMEGTVSHSFIVLTVPSSGTVRDYGESMPALLDPTQCLNWLEYNEIHVLESLVKSAANNYTALTAHSVSPAFRDLNRNSPALIAPAPTADQFGNYTLFS
jgi:putative SOS response-associated peptidase YedK